METQIINSLEYRLMDISRITTKVILNLTKDTEGLIDTTSKTSSDLRSNLNLINSTIECEMIRRMGV